MAKKKWKEGERKGFTLDSWKVQKVAGITFDFRRIDAAWWSSYTKRVEAANKVNDTNLNIELGGEMIEKIVTGWPFSQPITKEGFLNLSIVDAKTAVDALNVARDNVVNRS